MEKNVFETPTYYLQDFDSREEMLKHLEWRILTLIREYQKNWRIDMVERDIQDTAVSAKIYMSR